LLTVIGFHWLFGGTVIGFLASAALVLSVRLPQRRNPAARTTATAYATLMPSSSTTCIGAGPPSDLTKAIIVAEKARSPANRSSSTFP